MRSGQPPASVLEQTEPPWPAPPALRATASLEPLELGFGAPPPPPEVLEREP